MSTLENVKHRFYEDSAGDLLETSNVITDQMILSEDSSSQALIESRGLPRVASSPGPIKFDQASAEASSFLNQEIRQLQSQNSEDATNMKYKSDDHRKETD